MINGTKAVLGTAAALAACVVISGCHTADGHVTWHSNGMPRHQHPRAEWWNYQFVYHPHEQVYFEPYSMTYYWFENGQWEQGPEVPATRPLLGKDARIVKLQHQVPYKQHETVVHWHWGWGPAVPGSTDPVHATPEALALSEERAELRAMGIVGAEAALWYQSQQDLISGNQNSSNNGNVNDDSTSSPSATGTWPFPGRPFSSATSSQSNGSSSSSSSRSGSMASGSSASTSDMEDSTEADQPMFSGVDDDGNPE